MPIDARLWRERLLSAMENVSPEARVVHGAGREELEGERYRLPSGIRDAFREGNFIVRSLRGLFSMCQYDRDGATSTAEEDGVQVFRSFRNQLLELVTGTPRAEETAAVSSDDAGGTSGATTAVTADVLAPGRDDAPASEQRTASGSRRKLSRDELQRRYQMILDKLGEFNVPVHVPSDPAQCFVEGPASVLFRVVPGTGVDPKRIFEKSDPLKLGLALAESQHIRFGIDRGFVNIDVPKSEEDRYFITAAELWKRWERPSNELAVALGEDRFGGVVQVCFSSANSPHLLIGGTTGSGKSEALNTILFGFTKHYGHEELRLLLIDPKGTELQAFAGSPHLEGQIGWDEKDAMHLLERGVQQMQWRYRRFREVGVRSLAEHNAKVPAIERIPWWVLVLDEYADLTSDPDSKRDIEASLKRLAQKARAAGIHVIIATQKPSAEVISTNLRSNLPAQLALHVKSATESRVIMDEAGAETLNGKGDSFLKAEGRLTRVQCAKV
jgi:DNA segregation ATPase FtsK/SpoIIIE, S-DNA-T family